MGPRACLGTPARRALYSAANRDFPQIFSRLRSRCQQVIQVCRAPAASIPLTTITGQSTTSTAAKTTRVLTLVPSLHLRWKGLGCHLSGQRTYSFSLPALPLYTPRFYPLTLPRPLALVNLSCNFYACPARCLSLFHPFLGNGLLFQTSNICPQRFIFSNYYLYVPTAISRRVLGYKRLCLCGLNPSRNPSPSSTPTSRLHG